MKQLGTILRVDGVTLKVTKADGCAGCYYEGTYDFCTLLTSLVPEVGPCKAKYRSDDTDVIFKKV